MVLRSLFSSNNGQDEPSNLLSSSLQAIPFSLQYSSASFDVNMGKGKKQSTSGIRGMASGTSRIDFGTKGKLFSIMSVKAILRIYAC